MHARSTLLLTACGALAAPAALGTPPAHTITKIAQSGNLVTNPPNGFELGNIDQINQFDGLQHRNGFLRSSVNSAGSWLLHITTPQPTGSPMQEALLRTQPIGGAYTPYVVNGTPGYLSAPTATAVPSSFLNQSMNNAGDAALVLAFTPDDTCSGCATTGVFFNTTNPVLVQGATLAAAGLAPGTTWGAFDSSTCLRLVDSNRLLVVSQVTESAVLRRIVLVAQLDAAGNVLSLTLIAKEGGPVGAGPATWTSIAPGRNAAAMNSAGTVVFSGTSSSGADGIYSTAGGGTFIATAGGPTPTPGLAWGPLAGSQVDINAAGVVAFSGLTASASGTFTEPPPDAGEVMDQEAHTTGNGPLNLIVGSLASDQDADTYRVIVTDPNTFSATTVPDPGSGFPGAAFDTVLTLVADPGESGVGATPGGRTQCDNVSPTVLQSTITGSGGRTRVGGSYFLSISTPKSRIGRVYQHYATNATQIIDGWSSDPSWVAFNAAGGGLVYWPDPSAAVIRSATTAGVQQPDLAAPALHGPIAINNAAGKIYWADPSPGRIRRSDLDGGNVEDVIPGSGVISTNSGDTLFADSCTGLTIDAVNGKLYWAQSIRGEINVANLDGTGAARVRRDYAYNGSKFPASITVSGTFAPGSVAIDTSAGTTGKVYFAGTITRDIERCDLDGTGRVIVVSGAGASAIAIDNAAGKLYWTNTAAGRVQRSNLDGTGAEDVAISPFPVGITLDAPGGFVYWTSTLDRVVRRASIAGALPAAPSDVVSVGADTGERAPDGPGKNFPYSGYLSGWTRFGAPSGPALPYQIRLTGATFEYAQSMLVKGAQKVAAVGDALPGVVGSVLVNLGPNNSPVRMTDRGDVMWVASYKAPTAFQNYTFQGFLLNQDVLISSGQTVSIANGSPTQVSQLVTGPSCFGTSTDGGYALVPANMLTAPFVQPDYALLFQFAYPASSGACCNATACSVSTPAACTGAYQGDSTVCGPPGNPTTCCRANFNQIDGISVQDIFDFLNAWFAGDPRADFNGGGLGVQDIFDFLNAWFAGCP
ncbi:MAG TPA: GC-type dockerin domain-anchored protein [Phycisphaerales bacterium]|nr:GC-type dockerin domain-anchored protein [Phycisphaerales bacterium]